MINRLKESLKSANLKIGKSVILECMDLFFVDLRGFIKNNLSNKSKKQFSLLFMRNFNKKHLVFAQRIPNFTENIIISLQ